MTPYTIPGATFTDLAIHEGHLYTITLAPGTGAVRVSRWVAGTPEEVFLDACNGNGFPRIWSRADGLWILYRPQLTGMDGTTIQLRNLTTGVHRAYFGGANAFYNSPALFGANGIALNCYGTPPAAGEILPPDTTRLLTGCHIYSYDGLPLQLFPPLPGTGIAYLNEDNTPVSVDANRGAALQWSMSNPEWETGLFIGEENNDAIGGVRAVYHDSVTTTFLAGQKAFVPKLAQYPGEERWAAITSNQQGTVTVLDDISAKDFGVGPIPPQPPTDPIVLGPGLYRVN